MASDAAVKAAREWAIRNLPSMMDDFEAVVASAASLLESFAAQEREACAKVCDDYVLDAALLDDTELFATPRLVQVKKNLVACDIAAAIRRRAEGA